MENKTLEQRLEKIEILLQSQKTLLLSQKVVFNLDELVQYTNLSHSFIYKLTSKGGIPFYRPNGKQLYFNKIEIDIWLQRNPAKTNEQIRNEVITQITLGNNKRK
ncbi:MAG: helix-turn-helix domain-containing protein [Sphingobacteriales bacterium]|nr:MAG: helix-turn-helix domain-containing protein [Sphingobacteriales bacterium]